MGISVGTPEVGLQVGPAFLLAPCLAFSVEALLVVAAPRMQDDQKRDGLCTFLRPVKDCRLFRTVEAALDFDLLDLA